MCAPPPSKCPPVPNINCGNPSLSTPSSRKGTPTNVQILRGRNLLYHSLRRRVESLQAHAIPQTVLMQQHDEALAARSAALRARRKLCHRQDAVTALLARERVKASVSTAANPMTATHLAKSPEGLLTSAGCPKHMSPHMTTRGWGQMQGTVFPSAMEGMEGPPGGGQGSVRGRTGERRNTVQVCSHWPCATSHATWRWSRVDMTGYKPIAMVPSPQCSCNAGDMFSSSGPWHLYDLTPPTAAPPPPLLSRTYLSKRASCSSSICRKVVTLVNCAGGWLCTLLAREHTQQTCQPLCRTRRALGSTSFWTQARYSCRSRAGSQCSSCSTGSRVRG
jgi:hypothetical protein